MNLLNNGRQMIDTRYQVCQAARKENMKQGIKDGLPQTTMNDFDISTGIKDVTRAECFPMLRSEYNFMSMYKWCTPV